MRDSYEAVLERVTGGNWSELPRGWAALGPGYGLMTSKPKDELAPTGPADKATVAAPSAPTSSAPVSSVVSSRGGFSSPGLSGSVSTGTATAAPAGGNLLEAKPTVTTPNVWQTPAAPLAAQQPTTTTTSATTTTDAAALFSAPVPFPEDESYSSNQPGVFETVVKAKAPAAPAAPPTGLGLLLGLAYFLTR